METEHRVRNHLCPARAALRRGVAEPFGCSALRRLAMGVVFVLLVLLLPLSVHAEDLGELSANPSNPDSTSNPFGAGSPFKSDGLKHPFSPYGSPYSNQSATDPYAADAPKLYDQQGNYRGKLSANLYDPASTSPPTAAMALRSRRTRSTIPLAPGIPTSPAIPRIPGAGPPK